MKRIILLTVLSVFFAGILSAAIDPMMKTADYKMIDAYHYCVKYQWNDNAVGSYLTAVNDAAYIYRKYQFDAARLKVMDDIYSSVKMAMARKDTKSIIKRVTEDSEMLMKKYATVAPAPEIDLSLAELTYTAYAAGGSLSNQQIIDGQSVVFRIPLYINVNQQQSQIPVSFEWEFYVNKELIHAQKVYRFTVHKTALECKWAAKQGKYNVWCKVRLIDGVERNQQDNVIHRDITVDPKPVVQPADVAVYGKVRANDQTGQGIDGAELSFMMHGPTQQTLTARSYQGGMFKLKLPIATYTLTVKSKGYKDFDIKYLKVEPGMKDVECLMSPDNQSNSAHLTFFVYQVPTKKPDKKADTLWKDVVEVPSQNSASLDQIVGTQIPWVYRPIENAEVELIWLPVAGSSNQGGKTYKTDKWGRTITIGLNSGVYGVKVTRKGYADYSEKVFTVNPGENIKRIFLTPTVKLADINGYVYKDLKKKNKGKNLKNLGISNAQVKLWKPQDPGSAGFEKTAITDKNGRYKFKSIPYGNYYLKITAAGYKDGDDKQVISESFHTWKNYLTPAGNTFDYRGTVVEPYANVTYPVANAELLLISGNSKYRAVSGMEGNFSFSNLPEVTFDSFTIQAKGFSTRSFNQVDPKKLQSLDLSLKPDSPRAHIGVTVRSGVTQKPISGCSVLIYNKNSKNYQVTLKDGTCRFSLVSDPYFVNVQLKGYERYEKEYKLYKDDRIEIVLYPVKDVAPPEEVQTQGNDQTSSGSMFK